MQTNSTDLFKQERKCHVTGQSTAWIFTVSVNYIVYQSLSLYGRTNMCQKCCGSYKMDFC